MGKQPCACSAALAWRAGRGRRRETYTNTYLGQSCFNGAGAGPLVGARGAGAAGLAHQGQLSAQKAELSRPLWIWFPVFTDRHGRLRPRHEAEQELPTIKL